MSDSEHTRVAGTDYTGQETQWHDMRWILECPKCHSAFSARVPTKRRFYRQTVTHIEREEDGTEKEVVNVAQFPEWVIQKTLCPNCKAGRRKKKEFGI